MQRTAASRPVRGWAPNTGNNGVQSGLRHLPVERTSDDNLTVAGQVRSRAIVVSPPVFSKASQVLEELAGKRERG